MSKGLKATGSTGETFRGRKVLGVTKDGIRILKPQGRPTHFTYKEALETVKAVIAARNAG